MKPLVMSKTLSLDVCGIWASNSQRTGPHQPLEHGTRKTWSSANPSSSIHKQRLCIELRAWIRNQGSCIRAMLHPITYDLVVQTLLSTNVVEPLNPSEFCSLRGICALFWRFMEANVSKQEAWDTHCCWTRCAPWHFQCNLMKQFFLQSCLL